MSYCIYGVSIWFYKENNVGSFNLSFEEYFDIVKLNSCHYCGTVLPNTGSGLDRKNGEPYYAFGNCVACCTECNKSFNNFYNYEEKLIMAEARKKIITIRQNSMNGGVDTNLFICQFKTLRCQ